jgi:hypothetical protein
MSVLVVDGGAEVTEARVLRMGLRELVCEKRGYHQP